MVNLYRQDGETLYGIKEYIIDNMDDVKSLPTNVSAGSVALTISTGQIYMLNGNKEWVEFGSSLSLGDGASELLQKIDANKNGVADEVEMTIF